MKEFLTMSNKELERYRVLNLVLEDRLGCNITAIQAN